MDTSNLQSYLGVKVLKAVEMNLGDYNLFRGWGIPVDEDPLTEGYLVVYPDGYRSWSPKEAFEKCYLPLTVYNKITEVEIDNLLLEPTATKIDEKTTLVKIDSAIGYVNYEVSSCVDPANYDHDLGIRLATDKVKNKLWPLLGFVLQWGINGLKYRSK